MVVSLMSADLQSVQAGAMQSSPLQKKLDETIAGLGFELVDLELAQGGMLRLFIDLPVSANRTVNVEDCEFVTRHLLHWLTVEAVEYDRLEVSSPGVDRPLKQTRDFERFVGERVKIKLRRALQGRRNFEGVLVDLTQEQLLVVNAGDDSDSPEQVGGDPQAVSNEARRWGLQYQNDRGEWLQITFGLQDLDAARLSAQVSLRKDGQTMRAGPNRSGRRHRGKAR